jgi:glycosyltransferase involved in cell wall biosynthesis
MRILQVVHGFPPRNVAGTEVYTSLLSMELSKRHEVYVLYPAYGKFRYSFNYVERNGLNICELNIPFSERIMRLINLKSTYVNTKVEGKFRELINKIKPDCIHFQHLTDLSASLIEVAKEKGIPTVLTLHDYWFVCPATQLLKHDSTICNGPDEQAENCFRCWNNEEAELLADILGKRLTPKMFPEEVFESILMKMNSKKKFRERREYMKPMLLKIDRIVAPSVFLRNMFIRHGISGTKIVYSSNGCDLSAFRGFKKTKHENLVFGFVGTVEKIKGVDVLVEAFKKIHSRNVELRVYGRYDRRSKFFKGLQTKIRNNNIKFMGRFNDLKDPYSEIDVLIVPSIWYETGGPLVVKEAFATKTPLIASNIGSIPEFVIDGENGLLFKAGDSEDLLEKIKMIIADSTLINKFQKNITPPKSIEDQSRELEELYFSQMNRKHV